MHKAVTLFNLHLFDLNMQTLQTLVAGRKH